jgi:hypothetical protein
VEQSDDDECGVGYVEVVV